MTQANIYERRAYIKALIDAHEHIDCKEVCKAWGVSWLAIKNDISIVTSGKPEWVKPPSVVSSKGQNIRARRFGITTTVSAKEWVAICKRYGNKCAICGSKESLTMDHIVALSMGGTHAPDNLQPLCKSCNSRKGGRPRKPAGRPAKEQTQ